MKEIISTLTKEEVENNFNVLTDEFVEELVVLLYNSDVILGEKIYAEMQSKLDEEELISDLIACLNKIKNIAPFKEYLKSYTEDIVDMDEVETLFWLFCERGDKDEATYWLDQIEEGQDFNKAKQYYEAFFSIEELCKKIITGEEKLYFSYSHDVINKVIMYDNEVVDIILKQLESSDVDSEKQTITYSLLHFADNNTGSEAEKILKELSTQKLSISNKLFLINILLKNGKTGEALDLYHNEFQTCINEIIDHKKGLHEIGETHMLLNEKDALLETHSHDYIRLINSYEGADFSSFVSPLYSLTGIQEYLQKQNRNDNISANNYAVILARNGHIKEASAVLEKGKDEYSHKIWRLICLMCMDNKQLFLECLENDLCNITTKAELLLKMADYYLTKDIDLSKDCIKKAEKLIPELYIYHQNIYKKEMALLYYKIGDTASFKETYRSIDSLLAKIELLNAV
ncbi:hypothetical protein [Chryseobacterium sp. BIGb0232]|uniref:hypothetical protein n=1 Tax=Chryseobacterium sp. BIGb0232 TaxID=2940598 RepID=UPI000F4A1BC2|nr:hypothetical protein [Chryseobacterium sp. BIGb0232]MCS4304078.1 putative glutamine amidotransferase [Chryseobacterium sp. BIGb0232]ROS17660.1 hypothetical protein EDF65_2034 [Chryseobacterium nakagawai]